MTVTAPPVWFDVPDAFTALDLGADAAPRVELMVARTPALRDEQRVHLVLTQEIMIERLRAGQVAYAAHGLFRVAGDRPRLSVAQLTVSTHRVDVGSENVLDSIAARLAVPGLRRQVGFLDLAVGRALTVVEDRRFSTGATVFGQARDREHVVRQVQLMLPFPDRRHLATVALSTEFLHDWSDYIEIVGAVARSVSFTAPDTSPRGADGPSPNLIRTALDDPVRP